MPSVVPYMTLPMAVLFHGVSIPAILESVASAFSETGDRYLFIFNHDDADHFGVDAAEIFVGARLLEGEGIGIIGIEGR